MQRQLGVQQKSRRDDISVENSTFTIKKSRRARRDDTLLTAYALAYGQSRGYAKKPYFHP
jgi:alpha-D-ribose 1-methylphosphonate 5-triphosphate synthase subunit PhnI